MRTGVAWLPYTAILKSARGGASVRGHGRNMIMNVLPRGSKKRNAEWRQVADANVSTFLKVEAFLSRTADTHRKFSLNHMVDIQTCGNDSYLLVSGIVGPTISRDSLTPKGVVGLDTPLGPQLPQRRSVVDKHQ
ncbi:hypothetical protein CEXT_770141 [Caerostris extrusa]|uniref:Uncharacterized protein n=1 Tax=Caerostris extrusa TaxID=172846 RepID=A0AAV4N3Q7_CAEEX|nr:hypothetical protein CEXT_770141 [Caerostris extrusa]